MLIVSSNFNLELWHIYFKYRHKSSKISAITDLRPELKSLLIEKIFIEFQFILNLFSYPVHMQEKYEK